VHPARLVPCKALRSRTLARSALPFRGHRSIEKDFVIAIGKATRPRRSRHSNIASSRGAANEVERSRITQFEAAEFATDAAVSLVDGESLQTLLDAVEDQRVNLVNVIGIVQSMRASFTDTAGDSAPEVSAAFALLEQEIQRVVAGLKKASIRDPA
jgi:hypothetical protein